MRNMLWALTVGILAVAAGSLQAIPLIDVDFDAMTAGVAPPTAAYVPGGTITNPTYIYDVIAPSSILVQNSFTAGSATLSSKPCVLTDSTTAASPRMEFWSHYLDYEGRCRIPAGFRHHHFLDVPGVAAKSPRSSFAVTARAPPWPY